MLDAVISIVDSLVELAFALLAEFREIEFTKKLNAHKVKEMHKIVMFQLTILT